MDNPYRLLVGIDWAKEEHTVCVIDSNQQIVDRRVVPHSGAGLAQWCDALGKLCGGDTASVAVAVETPRGAVVECLVERGYAVYSLNPKQVDRFRDRHTVAGAKDDRRDAFVMADALRTDRHLFHRVRRDDPLIIRIRELSRAEQDVQSEQVRSGHQLQDLLNRYYPQMLALCPAADEPWFWDLLELVPRPGAKIPSRAKLQHLLNAHRIRRLEAAHIRQALDVPALELAPGAAAAASEHALLLVPILRLFQRQRKELERRINALLDEMSTEGQFAEHRDVTVLRSLPGVGRVITATMLAEAAQALAERDYHALRCYGGAAPVTRRSAKRTMIVMRQSCNQRLRNALYHWSRVSSQCDEHSKQHYAALRAKGHSHGRALRGVADRLLAVLVAMLESGTTYDPHRRRSPSG